MRDGVDLCCFGQRYADEAIFSAETVKTHSAANITLFTDRDVKSEYLDLSSRFLRSKEGKGRLFSASPYDRNSTSTVTRKLSGTSRMHSTMLDKFDIAQFRTIAKERRWSNIPEYQKIPYAFPEFNGGVIFFRKSAAVESFFECWKKYFYEYEDETQGQDQASFRIALWERTSGAFPSFRIQRAQSEDQGQDGQESRLACRRRIAETAHIALAWAQRTAPPLVSSEISPHAVLTCSRQEESTVGLRFLIRSTQILHESAFHHCL